MAIDVSSVNNGDYTADIPPVGGSVPPHCGPLDRSFTKPSAKSDVMILVVMIDSASIVAIMSSIPWGRYISLYLFNMTALASGSNIGSHISCR